MLAGCWPVTGRVLSWRPVSLYLFLAFCRCTRSLHLPPCTCSLLLVTAPGLCTWVLVPVPCTWSLHPVVAPGCLYLFLAHGLCTRSLHLCCCTSVLVPGFGFGARAVQGVRRSRDQCKQCAISAQAVRRSRDQCKQCAISAPQSQAVRKQCASSAPQSRPALSGAHLHAWDLLQRRDM